MSLKDENIVAIQSVLTRRDILEALAEECNELAQASLKLIRSADISNNPTPKTFAECQDNLIEEISDVLVCLEVLGGRNS